MSQVNQHKAGILLSYVNLLLGCVVPIIYTPIMLNILGKAEYGVYALSQSVTSYLNLLNLGLSTAMIRYLAKYRASGDIMGVRRMLGLFLTLFGCAAMLVGIIGCSLSAMSDRFFAKGLTDGEIQRLQILVVIMTGSVMTAFLNSAFSTVIVTYERFIFARVFAIAGTVLTPCVNLVLLYIGKGSVGMAVAALVLQMLTMAGNVLYCSRRLNITPCFRKMPVNLLKELVGFCFFTFLATIADMLYWSTDKVLIGAVIGSVAVAVYNVGGVFTTIMQNMAHAISQVFTPRVMMMASKENQSMEEVSGLLVRVGRVQCYVVCFILSGFLVFGQRFIMIWSGEGYEEAFYIALLTMTPLAVPLIQTVALSTIMAKNKHRFRAVVYTAIAVVNVVTTYIVLPYWGIIGAAACTAVAFALGNGVIMNIYYHRVIKLDIPGFWKSVLPMIIFTLVIAGGSWFVMNRLVGTQDLWVFLTGVIIYSLIFWGLHWFISMSQYEKQLILGFIRKGKTET